MFFNIGRALDLLYYKFFPPADKGIGIDKHSEPRNNGAIIDYRGMSEEEFLHHAEPDLELLEQIRIIKYNVYELRKKIAIPLCAVLLPACGYIDYWLLWLQRNSDDSGAGITFAIAGGIYWWVTQPKREYAIAYKERILPKLAKLFGNFIYQLHGRIDMGILKPSKIIPSHDKYKTEDYFEGTYKGVDMKFCEATLTEQQGSGKNRRTVTKFKGLIILLGMKNKRFYGHTTLQKDAGKITEWFKERSSQMKRARMVDPEFEKIFDAYTTDQVEARYLIDPLMIEDLKTLYQSYNGQSMAAAWYDSQMLIMISSKHNHFEPAHLYISATDPGSILKMKYEIGQILSIVDRLQLYDPHEIEEARIEETKNHQAAE